MLREVIRGGGDAAVFLDRDGVILEDTGYLKDPNDAKLCEGAKDLLKALAINKIPAIVVTNQSGIGRGYYEWKDYEAITEKMLYLLGSPALITAIYANSCVPGMGDDIDWRKPKPGMIIAASVDYGIRLNKSVMVGDRLCDLQAGRAAGIGRLVHVGSSRYPGEAKLIMDWEKGLGAAWNKNNCTSIEYLDTLSQFHTGKIGNIQ